MQQDDTQPPKPLDEGGGSARTASLSAEPTLPCDVLVPPRTIIRAGCAVPTLLLAIEQRAKWIAKGESIERLTFPPDLSLALPAQPTEDEVERVARLTREPTDEMLDAGCAAFRKTWPSVDKFLREADDGYGKPLEMVPEPIIAAWQAMYDVAAMRPAPGESEVERVARALCAKSCQDEAAGGYKTVGCPPCHMWEDYCGNAQVALAAMRLPPLDGEVREMMERLRNRREDLTGDYYTKQMLRDRNAAADMIERLARQEQEARNALALVEFGSYQIIGNKEGLMCPLCHNFRREGHKPDCTLAALIKSPSTERT